MRDACKYISLRTLGTGWYDYSHVTSLSRILAEHGHVTRLLCFQCFPAGILAEHGHITRLLCFQCLPAGILAEHGHITRHLFYIQIVPCRPHDLKCWKCSSKLGTHSISTGLWYSVSTLSISSTEDFSTELTNQGWYIKHFFLAEIKSAIFFVTINVIMLQIHAKSIRTCIWLAGIQSHFSFWSKLSYCLWFSFRSEHINPFDTKMVTKILNIQHSIPWLNIFFDFLLSNCPWFSRLSSWIFLAIKIFYSWIPLPVIFLVADLHCAILSNPWLDPCRGHGDGVAWSNQNAPI
jgi:hypothetical protein